MNIENFKKLIGSEILEIVTKTCKSTDSSRPIPAQEWDELTIVTSKGTLTISLDPWDIIGVYINGEG